jgi:hypothetical protein
MVSGTTTLIEYGGSDTVCTPSLTLMTIFEYVAAWLVVGVPDNIPVEALKLAQVGRPFMENVSDVPLGVFVVGWKL